MSNEELEQEGQGSMNNKAETFKRVVAVIIDSIIACIISGAIPWVGGLIGGAYFLTRDGLGIEALNGQSIGKKLMKIKVVGPVESIDYITSIKRNITLGFVYVIYPIIVIPVLGHLVMLVASLAQLALGVVELYKVISDPDGRRIGDQIADTRVIEE
ncbi:RDD family protein [candidate division CSSED10-310 bacterium]|uniref:RDD family protein n=1 Tax=candidate division CSSED10-310 bacterium TaxID=2855610 RepID=A0ABV6Z010_UNCC1